MQNNSKKTTLCTNSRFRRTPVKNLARQKMVKRKHSMNPKEDDSEKRIKTDEEEATPFLISKSLGDISHKLQILGCSMMGLCEEAIQRRKNIIDIIREGKTENWESSQLDDENISKTLEEVRKEQQNVMENLLMEIQTLALKSNNQHQYVEELKSKSETLESRLEKEGQENNTNKLNECIDDMRLKLQAAQNKTSVLENRHLTLQKTIQDLDSKLRAQIDSQAKLKQQMENEKNNWTVKVNEKDRKYSNLVKLMKDEKEKNSNKINHLVEIAEVVYHDIEPIIKMENALNETNKSFECTNILKVIKSLMPLREHLNHFVQLNNNIQSNNNKKSKFPKPYQSSTSTRCPSISAKAKDDPHIRFDKMRKEIEQLHSNLTEKEKDLDEMTKKYKNAEQTSKNNQEKIIVLEEQLKEALEHLAGRIEENHKMEDSLKTAYKEIENLNNQVAFFKVEYGRMQEQRTRNEARIATLENQLDKQPSRERSSFRFPFFN